ncbi:MAG: hypothetical protein Q7U04_07210 [Bacteriovorax sp.]|nr:hypothetical protein [Bacteriovorax sp.]
MQLNKLLISFIVMFSAKTFSYECKPTELKLEKLTSKKVAYQLFQKNPRKAVVDGALHELVTLDPKSKMQVKKTEWMLSYLENTELNSDQQTFFQLLQSASEIDAKTPKKLYQKELCEIMEKVNLLVAKKASEKVVE